MILPDYKQRNELKFLVAQDLPYNLRLLLVAALWALGLAVQAILAIWPGAAIILAGTILALTRGYSNEPRSRWGGKTRWENVTAEQFRRIIELDRESRRWDRSAWIDATNRWGCLTFLLLAAALFLGARRLWPQSAGLARLCLIDGFVFFVPFWVTGIRRLYHRTELMIRVHALENILRRLEEPDAKDLSATPMLELRKTKDGDLPLDVKLMVRFSDAPDDFMGIQVQVAINSVQNNKYPYLYCVILAKPGFGLAKWDLAPPPRASKILVKPSQTDEVELLVVRQKTTRRSGYHTNRAAQRRVFDAALEICRRNLRLS